MVREKGEVRVGRFSIPYRVYGDSEATFVCVNGAQQTMAVWRSLISYFSDDYSVVTFDMPGAGRARVERGPPEASFEEQVDILAEVIEATRRSGPLVLAGCSWGTMAAAAYAARHPEEVDKLVLGSFGVKPSKVMMEVIREGQQLYEQGEHAAAAHLIIDRFGAGISPGYKRQILQQFARISQEQATAFYRHCCFVEGVGHIDEYVALDRITAKTLVINGANDTLLDLEDLQVARARIPNCTTRVVEDAGHFLHFERPDILGIYAEFLAQ